MADEKVRIRDRIKAGVDSVVKNPHRLSFKEYLTMRPASTMSESFYYNFIDKSFKGLNYSERAEQLEILSRKVTLNEFRKIHSGEEAGKDGVIDAPLPGSSLVNRIRFYSDERFYGKPSLTGFIKAFADAEPQRKANVEKPTVEKAGKTKDDGREY